MKLYWIFSDWHMFTAFLVYDIRYSLTQEIPLQIANYEYLRNLFEVIYRFTASTGNYF